MNKYTFDTFTSISFSTLSWQTFAFEDFLFTVIATRAKFFTIAPFFQAIALALFANSFMGAPHRIIYLNIAFIFHFLNFFSLSSIKQLL